MRRDRLARIFLVHMNNISYVWAWYWLMLHVTWGNLFLTLLRRPRSVYWFTSREINDYIIIIMNNYCSAC